MHLLFYIVAFVTSEGGDWGTTRRSSCLHKGVRVPNVRYLMFIRYRKLVINVEERCPNWDSAQHLHGRREWISGVCL